MPRSRLSDIRLPELDLPEMTRDDIIRVVGDVRRDVDLGRFDPRRIDLGEVELPAIELKRIDLSKVDVPKALATAAQAVGIVRTARRSRLPFVVGGLAAVTIVGIALMSSPMVRPRLVEAARRVRDRFEARRAATQAADVPVGIAIEPSAYAAPVASAVTEPVSDAAEPGAAPAAQVAAATEEQPEIATA